MQNSKSEKERRAGIERRWIKVQYDGTEKRTGEERRYVRKDKGILHNFDADNHVDQQ